MKPQTSLGLFVGLLAHAPKVSAQTASGLTSLHLAALKGHAPVAALLARNCPESVGHALEGDFKLGTC